MSALNAPLCTGPIFTFEGERHSLDSVIRLISFACQFVWHLMNGADPRTPWKSESIFLVLPKVATRRCPEMRSFHSFELNISNLNGQRLQMKFESAVTGATAALWCGAGES